MTELLEELLARCQRGEEDAIGALVQRFRVWAVDFAAALIEDRQMAEDAVQEGFLKALRRLPELRDPKAFPGWFRQIIRTETNRILRKQRERPNGDGSDLVSPSLPPENKRRKNIYAARSGRRWRVFPLRKGKRRSFSIYTR